MSPKSILIAEPRTFDAGAGAQPIPSRWVLSGTPETRTWRVLRSRDLTEDIVVWECTAGRFRCDYSQDETVMVVSGEVFITHANDEERRLGPGDLGFFPAGTSCVWRVPEKVRKIAVLRETNWLPFGFALKVWKRLLRIAGLTAPGAVAMPANTPARVSTAGEPSTGHDS